MTSVHLFGENHYSPGGATKLLEDLRQNKFDAVFLETPILQPEKEQLSTDVQGAIINTELLHCCFSQSFHEVIATYCQMASDDTKELTLEKLMKNFVSFIKTPTDGNLYRAVLKKTGNKLEKIGIKQLPLETIYPPDSLKPHLESWIGTCKILKGDHSLNSLTEHATDRASRDSKWVDILCHCQEKSIPVFQIDTVEELAHDV